MRASIILRTLCALSFILIASACASNDEGTFDPRGDEVALYGEWDVNGENPALVDACRVAGLESVGLVFYEPGSATAFIDEDFLFPCDAGVYESRGGVLRPGSFEYQWRAYEPGKPSPVLESSRYPLSMTRSGEFILQAVDFIRVVAP